MGFWSDLGKAINDFGAKVLPGIVKTTQQVEGHGNPGIQWDPALESLVEQHGFTLRDRALKERAYRNASFATPSTEERNIGTVVALITVPIGLLIMAILWRLVRKRGSGRK